MLPKAKESIQKGIDLGDTSMADKVPFVDELLKYEGFVKRAMKNREYREALFYSTRLLDQCQDSVRHVKMRIKAAIMHNPNDLSETIKMTYNV